LSTAPDVARSAVSVSLLPPATPAIRRCILTLPVRALVDGPVLRLAKADREDAPRRAGADRCERQPTMETSCGRTYSRSLIRTCHRRGAHAMRSMAAQLPVQGDIEATGHAMAKARADKRRDAHDGTRGHLPMAPLAAGLCGPHTPGASPPDAPPCTGPARGHPDPIQPDARRGRCKGLALALATSRLVDTPAAGRERPLRSGRMGAGSPAARLFSSPRRSSADTHP